LHKWAERKSHHQYLSEFYAIKRRNDETVTRFNRRFENTYHNFPVDIRPSEVVAKVYYTLAHHPDLAFYLRERKSPTLEQMFTDVEEIENNLWACGKLLGQIKDENLDTEEQREEDEQNKSDMYTSLIHIVEKQKESLNILNQQYDNEWENDFCINFLSNFHNGKNEFSDDESEQDSCYRHIHENFQEDTFLLSTLEDKSQGFIWKIDTSSQDNNGEFQIHSEASRNLICDEYLMNFIIFKDQGKMSEFPYFEILFEHCCNEGFKSILEHRQDCSYNSKEHEENIFLPFRGIFSSSLINDKIKGFEDQNIGEYFDEHAPFKEKSIIMEKQFSQMDQVELFTKEMKVIFHDFEDPVAVFLESSGRVSVTFFFFPRYGSKFYVQLQISILLCFKIKIESIFHSNNQLFGWLHWKFHFT
jgi:hypothetical protein